VLLCLLLLCTLTAAASSRSAAALYPRAALAVRSAGVTVVLAGGSGPAELRISLSADGSSYLISSSTPLETGGDVCSNPPGDPDQLSCRAVAVAGFDFNGGPGDNTVIVGKSVPAPVTLRGGSGNDLLVGGGGDDTLIGGPGENVLIGGPGADHLYGGADDDLLIGGPGHDVCNGGAGENAALGCEVEKNVAVSCASLGELRAAAGPSPCARWARHHPGAISRLPSLRR
jgi:RTX calcium-binding nonapeptide repeat (4 copies)